MTRRRRLVLAAAAALALAAATIAITRSPAAPRALALRLSPGSEYDYAVSWQSRQTTRLAGDGGALAGSVDLRGRLVVRAYAEQGQGWLVGIRFADLATRDVVVQGHALDTADLARGEAFAEIGRDGAIAGMWFRGDAPPLFAQLVPVLASQLEFRFAGGGAWQAASPGPFGASTARYRRTADGATRVRDAYAPLAIVPGGATATASEVESTAAVALAPEGHWTKVADTERIAVPAVDADVALALDLIAVRATGPVARPSLHGLDRRMPGAPVGNPGGARKALLDKVGGLTRAELLVGLSAGGRIADVDRWLWRATGLVELEPALAAEIGELVASGKLAGKNAEIALDVLASTGTPEAQVALCRALASAPVRTSKDYGLLVQRVSLVARPTDETARFVGELYQREAAGEAAYALGAVARHLGESGHDAAARAWNAVLADDLARTDEPSRQAILLGALGNAARSENVELVVRHAAADSAEVRAAAARALRHTDEPRAREALHELFGDRDAEVQHEAIAALARHRIDNADLVRLERSLATSGIAGGNEDSLVALVARHLDADASPAILRAIAARPDTLPELRARIEGLLARRSGS